MPRRVVAAAAAALSLVVLAGCRIENPKDAAYVGDTRHSQAEVDRIVAGLKADGAKLADNDRTPLRQRIVGDLVFVDVAKRYADEKKYGDPTVDAGALAQAYGLPPGDAFVALEARAQGYQSLLQGKVAPANVTDADYHDTYDLLLRQQAVQAGSEASVTQQLRQQFATQLGAALGLRKEMTSAMNRYGTSVNPSLLPVGYPLLSASTSGGGSVTLVQLPLAGSGTVAPVRDLPAPAATLVPQSAQ